MYDALASGLELEQLGARFITLVAASELARHADARCTVRDYGHPDAADLEGQFVQDLLCCSTPDVLRKWFGGSAIRYLTLARELTEASV
jgi:hypothetical protein